MKFKNFLILFSMFGVAAFIFYAVVHITDSENDDLALEVEEMMIEENLQSALVIIVEKEEEKAVARAPASIPKPTFILAKKVELKGIEKSLELLQKKSRERWVATFDYKKKYVKVLKSGSLDLPGNDALEKTKLFLDSYSSTLFHAPKNSLQLDNFIESQYTKVIYNQKYNNLEIWGATVSLIYDEDGGLIRVNNGLFSFEKGEDLVIGDFNLSKIGIEETIAGAVASFGHGKTTSMALDSKNEGKIFMMTNGELLPALKYNVTTGDYISPNLKVLIGADNGHVLKIVNMIDH